MSGILQKTSIYAYDSIGNLLSITSDTNQSFDWEGRRLIEHSVGGSTYTYTYNDQGIRTSKSNGTTTTEYFLDGSLVLFEKTGNDVIYYTYDVDGSLLSMNYNSDEYFYIKNLQGDIIEIVNASGNTVATYRYDAWGNVIYQWDSGLGIAHINPYRYRGYRFDTETGLYYLNARYYDPSIGRFISADSINYLDPSSEQGLSLYAYCGNNPIMRVDEEGNFWNLIAGAAIGAIIGAATSVVVQLVTTGEVKIEQVLLSAGTGAVSGFLASTGIGIIGSGIAGTIIGGTQDIASQLITNGGDIEKLDLLSVAISAGIGGIAGLMSGKGFQTTKTHEMKTAMINLKYTNTAMPSTSVAQQISSLANNLGKQATSDFLKTSVRYIASTGFASSLHILKGLLYD